MAKTPLEIKSLARAHTHGAIKVLAGIMNEKKAPPAARVAAANALLDRGYGKAPQHFSAEVTHQWQDVAKSEFDGWIAGLFERELDAPEPLELTDDRIIPLISDQKVN